MVVAVGDDSVCLKQNPGEDDMNLSIKILSVGTGYVQLYWLLFCILLKRVLDSFYV